MFLGSALLAPPPRAVFSLADNMAALTWVNRANAIARQSSGRAQLQVSSQTNMYKLERNIKRRVVKMLHANF